MRTVPVFSNLQNFWNRQTPETWVNLARTLATQGHTIPGAGPVCCFRKAGGMNGNPTGEPGEKGGNIISFLCISVLLDWLQCSFTTSIILLNSNKTKCFKYAGLCLKSIFKTKCLPTYSIRVARGERLFPKGVPVTTQLPVQGRMETHCRGSHMEPDCREKERTPCTQRQGCIAVMVPNRTGSLTPFI